MLMDFTMTRKTPSNETPANPAVTFSPEALAQLLNECTEQRRVIAELLKTQAQPSKAAKPAKAPKAGPKLATSQGRTERQIANELEVVKRFRAQGYADVRPHETVRTFNRWMAEGMRPMKGTKSLKINGLRLFHISQCEPVTAEQKAADQKQSDDAVKRHEAAEKAKAPAAEKAKADKPKGKLRGTVLKLPFGKNPHDDASA